MIIQLPFGNLIPFMSSFEAYNMELVEEKDIETEEKDGEEETEKDKLFNKYSSRLSLYKGGFDTNQYKNLVWNQLHSEIPTPPPQIIT